MCYLVAIYLCTSISLLSWGGILGKSIIKYICICICIISYILTNISFHSLVIIEKLTWLDFLNLTLKMSFLDDSLSYIMSKLIILITILIIIYSFEYMQEDPGLLRFIAYLFFFGYSMLLMVTAGNYLQYFIGWEFVGLASYILINFWYTRTEANKGAVKAVIFNRIGDVFFLIALGLIWLKFHSFDFGIIFIILPYLSTENYLIESVAFDYIDGIALCLFIAACAKSAQLFLHNWLLDAMEGPTPVSALLHSATMVTAGIFLLIRSSYIIMASNISNLILVSGLSTMIVAAIIGLCQTDLKRIIALSTCSQLGLMMISISFNIYHATFFHLVSHAFFKASLFLGSGIVIHALNEEQDIRRMGKLAFAIPSIYVTMVLCSLSLVGFPAYAGFYSKDFLLETIYSTFNSYAYSVFLLASIAAGITAMYSFRLIILVFLGKSTNIVRTSISNAMVVNNGVFFVVPIYILTLCALFFGYYAHHIFTVECLALWYDSLSIPISIGVFDIENEISFIYKLVPTILAIGGIVMISIYLQISTVYYNIILKFFKTKIMLLRTFFFDSIYHYYLTTVTMYLSYNVTYKIIDRGFLEIFGPLGLWEIFNLCYKNSFKLHSGSFLSYVLLGICCIFIVVLLLTMRVL
jgi:proton-translocating NADH-quinone oxidoreductase chain L